MPRYLISVTEDGARRLEDMLGGALFIRPGAGASPPGGAVAVASCDAVRDDEIPAALHRLRTGGPLYHTAGPGRKPKLSKIFDIVDLDDEESVEATLREQFQARIADLEERVRILWEHSGIDPARYPTLF